MILFIKSHLAILTPIFLLLITLDGFLLAFKLKNHLEFISNFKISYDIFKSYYLNFYYYGEYKLAIINLTLENKSSSPIDILEIKLIDGYKSYLSTLPQIKDAYNENGITLINNDKSRIINIDILSENILKSTKISSHAVLNGYVVFQDVEPINDTKTYTIILKTPKKVLKKEITINPINNEFHPVNLSES